MIPQLIFPNKFSVLNSIKDNINFSMQIEKDI